MFKGNYQYFPKFYWKCSSNKNCSKVDNPDK